ncbi:hypothetical protein J5N97_015469 [Dioscorea zingiberensis]|uniref:Transmembrane protein n=1 Tax=Dioscorea zingiberensis TaxID=325984 RepID=A0A9D5HKH7_9LILI|nr:hypothetical protein J5N97_015469 [Dioscorea zingiberensis]
MGEVVEGLAYWTRWQVVACALIIVITMAMSVSVILRTKKNGSVIDTDTWTTCWKTVHPLWLLFFRVLSLSVLFLVFYEVVLMVGTLSFYFYTQWTLMLVIFYFLIATFMSVHGCWVNSKIYTSANGGALIENNNKIFEVKSYADQEQFATCDGFCSTVMHVIYQTSAAASILTDIAFWGVLVPFLPPEGFTMNLVMGSVHSLNIIFLLIDTVLNNMSFPWFRISYFLLWSGIYVNFLWILNACGLSWWPYPFLELSIPWSPLCYLSMALFHVPCFAVYIWIVKAKTSYFPKWFPQGYISSSRNLANVS